MELIAGLEHFVRQNESLAPHTWLRLGGPAELFAEPNTTEELQTLVKRCHEQNVPVRIIGSGSNLLVRDQGVPGVVVALNHPAFASIQVEGAKLTTGGGAKLSSVVSTSVGRGLAGLESLAGVPGTVGGALHGNSGANGVDIGQHLVSADVMTQTGEIHTRQAGELQFTYRQSSLDELVILSATFELEQVDAQELTRRMQKFWIVQKAAQPGGGESVGYLFIDPPGLSASSLIEQAGLKTTKVGGAEICTEHPNFVVAGADATAEDVEKLATLVQSRVKEVTGVELIRQLSTW